MVECYTTILYITCVQLTDEAKTLLKPVGDYIFYSWCYWIPDYVNCLYKCIIGRIISSGDCFVTSNHWFLFFYLVLKLSICIHSVDDEVIQVIESWFTVMKVFYIVCDIRTLAIFGKGNVLLCIAQQWQMDLGKHRNSPLMYKQFPDPLTKLDWPYNGNWQPRSRGDRWKAWTQWCRVSHKDLDCSPVDIGMGPSIWAGWVIT